MEKLIKHSNGQWTLKKNEIDKRGYKFRHVKTSDNYSHYNIEHKTEGQVGHASLDRKTNKVNVTLPQPRFDHHEDHLQSAVKTFHIARNTNTGN